MSINLSQLDAAAASETVFDLELLHPTNDEPLGLFVQIVGVYSKDFQTAKRAQANELLKKDFETKRGGKNAKPPTTEDVERRSAKLLASATRGWFSVERATKNGEKDKIEQGMPFGDTRLMFSLDEAERLYGNPGYEWLSNQVDKAVGALENFLRP